MRIGKITIWLLVGLGAFSLQSFGQKRDKEKEIRDQILRDNVKVNYDLSKFDAVDALAVTRQNVDKSTLSVLKPKDIQGFYQAFPAEYHSNPLLHRTFAFPEGFGTDAGFILQLAAMQQGGLRGQAYVIGSYGVQQWQSEMISAINQWSTMPPTADRQQETELPLIGLLQNELTMAMSRSQTFRTLIPATGPMKIDLESIEEEMRVGQPRPRLRSGNHRPEPEENQTTPKMLKAEYFLISAIGIKGTVIDQTYFSGNNRLVNFIESILVQNSSSTKAHRIFQAVSVFRGLHYQANDIFSTTVVNLCLTKGREIVAGGYGIGVNKIFSAKSSSFSGMHKSRVASDDLMLDCVRSAVKDALNNFSAPL